MPRKLHSLLGRPGIRAVTLVLLLQAVAFYGFSRTEYLPELKPLGTLPVAIGPWMTFRETPIEPAILDVLQADDTLSRDYARPDGLPVNLFVAAFRTQRNGKAPHSPKNCLPGAGWMQTVNDRVMVDMPGDGPKEVNRYIVSKGDAKSVVLYWYQSRDRAIASELEAKFYVIADSLRYNRSDTALVRIVVPVPPGREALAFQEAVNFAKAAYPDLRNTLPR